MRQFTAARGRVMWKHDRSVLTNLTFKTPLVGPKRSFGVILYFRTCSCVISIIINALALIICLSTRTARCGVTLKPR